MGRNPCCSKDGMKRGAWTALEDKILTDYITAHGEGKWRSIPRQSGLKRCGKSCRLRWLNYLRPDIKRGNITHDEEDLIIRLHRLLGNRWSLIAGRLPGRTDNEIKNYWNSCLSKRVRGEHNSTEHTNHSKPKVAATGPGPEENHQPLLPPAAGNLPAQLPPDPTVKAVSAMSGDILTNNPPSLEYESSNVSSSTSTSREDLSNIGMADIFEQDFSSLDGFGFSQFESMMEGTWSSLEMGNF